MIDEEVLQSILVAPSVNKAERTFSMSSSLGNVKLIFSDKIEPEYAQYDGCGWVRVGQATLGDEYHKQNLFSVSHRPDPQTGTTPILTGFHRIEFPAQVPFCGG